MNKLFKNYMKQEISTPDYKKAKKDFLNANFKSAPFYTTTPFVSVMVVAFAVAGFHFLLPTQPKEDIIPTIAMKTPAAQVKTALPVETIPPVKIEIPEPGLPINETPDLPQIIVKDTSSMIGPTMVYQKIYPDSSMTVVWLVAGGT
jgi:hypothetical protein